MILFIFLSVAEQSKPATKTSPGPYIRRTASVDALYLLGQWQRDALYLSYCGRLMMDRATQVSVNLLIFFILMLLFVFQISENKPINGNNF